MLVIIHIYGAKAIFCCFVITKTLNLRYDKQKLVQLDQYPHRKLSNDPWYNDINTPQDGRKILWQLFIFMKPKPFFYYFMIAKTLNLSNEKCKSVYLVQYFPRKISTALWDNYIHTLQDWRKYCVNYLYLWRQIRFPTIL